MDNYKPAIKRKIGVGVITYNREAMFERVTKSLPFDKLHFCCAVNDGSIYQTDEKKKYDVYIQHIENKGVAAAKNIALSAMIGMGCDHLFLIEDDIVIKDPNVFDRYIDAASASGIWHLCFEKVGDNKKQIVHEHLYWKMVGDGYGKGIRMTFHRNPQGAFMYILGSVVKLVGGFDEKFKNAFEHIDFTYRCVQKGLLPPFWYFPDLEDSGTLLESIGEGNVSSITDKEGYKENWNKGAKHFIEKHGYFTNKIPVLQTCFVEEEIERIQRTYSHEA